MPFPKSILLRLFVASLAIFVPAAAQTVDVPDPTDTFDPPEIAHGGVLGSYPLNGFDTINNYSGQISFNLPLRPVGGRGEVGFTVALSIFQNWTIDQIKVGTSEYENPTPSSWATSERGYGPGFVEGRYSEWPSSCTGTNTKKTSTINFGGTQLRDTIKNGEWTSCTSATGWNRGTEFVALNGSGMTFISDDDVIDERIGTFQPDGTLYFPNGMRYEVNNGKIHTMTDRNGNKMTLTYESTPGGGWRVTSIKDPLLRETTISYEETCGSLDCDKIEFKGESGNARTIEIRFKDLGDLLKQPGPFPPGLQTYAELFPEPEIDMNVVNTHNPRKVSAVVLPDSRKYKFKYNEYGELVETILPTGGRFEYDWVSGTGTGGGVVNKTIIVRRVQERRTYLDETTSTWESRTVFSTASTADCGALSSGKAGRKSTVTHYTYPGTVENKEEHYYCGDPTLVSYGPNTFGSWKQGRKYKSAVKKPSGTLISETTITWGQRSGSGLSIWWGGGLEGDSAPVMDPRLEEQYNSIDTGGDSNKQQFVYDQYNNRTDSYEFENGTDTTPLRRTHFDYETASSYVDTPVHIRGMISKSWSCGSGTGPCDQESNHAAKTEYVYDSTSLTGRSNISNHDDSFGTGYTTRGNVTKVRRWRNLPTAKWIETHLEYDILGNPVKATDARANDTTLAYTDVFSNGTIAELNGKQTFAFVTAATQPLSQTVSSEFDYYLGTATKITDLNGIETTYEYNASLDRLKTAVVAANEPSVKRRIRFDYTNAVGNLAATVRSDQYVYDDGNLVATTYFDNLGREVARQGDDCSMEVRRYDGLGRLKAASIPTFHCGTYSQWSGGVSETLYSYSGGGTVYEQVSPGNAELEQRIEGHRITFTDEAGKTRHLYYSGIGQLVQVIEDPGDLNYITDYQYDPLGNRTQILQKGNNSSNVQTRTATFDSLGRLLTITTPEQAAATSYEYDDNGNVTKKTDARGVATNIVYDQLNRVIRTYYTNDSSSTSDSHYCYDGAVWDVATLQCIAPGSPIAYSLGKLTAHATPHSITHFTSFDAAGRPLATLQRTWDGSAAFRDYVFGYEYNRDGTLKSQTYPSGNRIDFTYDSAGRPYGAEDNMGGLAIVSSTAYNAFGSIAEKQIGNQLWEQTCLNGRGQPIVRRLGATVITGCTSQATDKLYLAFGYGPDATNNGNLVDHTILAPDDGSGAPWTAKQYYAYDGVNRLRTAAESAPIPANMQCPSTSSWCREYGYEHFGNRWVAASNRTLNMATPTSLSDIDSATNHLSSATYDAAGNMISHPQITPGLGGLTYDANSNVISFSATAIMMVTVYDATGKRVRQTYNGETTVWVYDAFGSLAAEYTTEATTADAGVYFRTTDHLGSTRLTTDYGGAVIQRRDFFPFGEEIPADANHANRNLVTDGGFALYNASLPTRQQFTGQQRDKATDLDYFWARSYSAALGRFLSPDPSGLNEVPQLPQSWNSCSYVENNPLKYTDPTGFQTSTRCGDGGLDTANNPSKGPATGASLRQLTDTSTEFGFFAAVVATEIGSNPVSRTEATRIAESIINRWLVVNNFIWLAAPDKRWQGGRRWLSRWEVQRMWGEAGSIRNVLTHKGRRKDGTEFNHYDVVRGDDLESGARERLNIGLNSRWGDEGPSRACQLLAAGVSGALDAWQSVFFGMESEGGFRTVSGSGTDRTLPTSFFNGFEARPGPLEVEAVRLPNNHFTTGFPSGRWRVNSSGQGDPSSLNRGKWIRQDSRAPIRGRASPR